MTFKIYGFRKYFVRFVLKLILCKGGFCIIANKNRDKTLKNNILLLFINIF